VPRPPEYRYSTLPEFLRIYRQVASCMRTPANFERVIREHAAAMAAQDIRYAEVSINPSLHPGEDWVQGVVDARREIPVEIAWLVELTREGSVEANERAVDLALSLEGTVGVGLVGDESIAATSAVSAVRRARSRGLRFMPHAGQGGRPEVVREALDMEADRIAHGVAAASDPRLMGELAERGVCLCVSPSSNARIGLRPDFRGLAGAGVTLTVNSDDPPFVGTTLTHELELAESELGLRREDLVDAAWRHRFI
jgi:adenosine deaminase